MSLLAFLSGILNTYQRFAAAAFAPVMLNVVMISVLGDLVFRHPAGRNARRHPRRRRHGCRHRPACVLFVACATGVFHSLAAPALHASAKRLLEARNVPGVAAGGSPRSTSPSARSSPPCRTGANALLYYADRLYQLPLGVIGIAIGVVLLPEPDAAAALRRRRAPTSTAQPGDGIRAGADPAGRRRADRHAGRNRLGAVPARRFGAEAATATTAALPPSPSACPRSCSTRCSRRAISPAKTR
jgi:hypothetical protein